MIYARLERFAPGVIRSWIRICVCHVFRGFRSTERNNHHPGNGYPFEFSIIVNSKDRFTISLSLSLFRKLNRKFHLQLELGTSTGGTVIYHNLFSRARAKSGGGEEQKLAPRERGRSIGQITATQKGKRNENGLPGAKRALRHPQPITGLAIFTPMITFLPRRIVSSFLLSPIRYRFPYSISLLSKEKKEEEEENINLSSQQGYAKIRIIRKARENRPYVKRGR